MLTKTTTPSGWKIVKIADIAKVRSGGTPSRKVAEYWNGNVPWVTTTEVNFGIINSTLQHISEEGVRKSSANWFPVGTILMAMYGQGKTRGQVALLGIKATTNQACCAIIFPKTENQKYYFYFLSSQYETIRELSNSGGQKNLSAGIIKNIQVPTPPLLEQQKIVELLETWDIYLKKLSKKIKLKKKIKKGLMQLLLTGKKRLPGFNERWRTVNLGDIGSIRTSSVDKLSHEGEKEVGLLNYMDVYKRDHVTQKDNFQKITAKDQQIFSSDLRKGDVLFTPSSETPNDIGHSAVVMENLENVVFSYHLIRFRPKEGNLHHEFSAYCFKTYQFYLGLWKKAQGATRYTLSKEALATTKIALPPSQEEQILIAKILSKISAEIETLEKKQKIIKRQKKFLLNTLVTGKIRFPEFQS